MRGDRELRGRPHLHSVGYANEKNSAYARVRWNGTGRVTDTYWPGELYFQFDTSEHTLPQEEVGIAPFWETMVGLRHLSSSLPMSRTIDETGFIDTVSRIVQTLWKKAPLAGPIPGITISPFKFEYDKEHGLYAISPDNKEQLFIKTLSVA
ncbi:MAG: hypothetical protein ACYC75_03845 [Minisyncoccota bacterium]